MTANTDTIPSLAAPPTMIRERSWYPYFLIAPSMITLVVVSLAPFIYAIF